MKAPLRQASLTCLLCKECNYHTRRWSVRVTFAVAVVTQNTCGPVTRGFYNNLAGNYCPHIWYEEWKTFHRQDNHYSEWRVEMRGHWAALPLLHVCHRAPSVPGIGALIRYLISSAFMHGWHFLDKPLSPDLGAVSSCNDDQLQNKTCIYISTVATWAQSANYKEYECEHLCVSVTTDDLTQEQERTKLTNTWHDSWHDSSTPPLGSHQVFLLRGRPGFCNNIIINLFIISDLKLIATTKLKRSHRIADSKINKSAYLKTPVSDGKHKQQTMILHRTNIQTHHSD